MDVAGVPAAHAVDVIGGDSRVLQPGTLPASLSLGRVGVLVCRWQFAVTLGVIVDPTARPAGIPAVDTGDLGSAPTTVGMGDL